MKVMLAQINTTPGDFKGNWKAISAGLEEVRKAELHKKPDMVVFPELAIPGYLSQDLMYHKGYVDQNLKTLHNIVNYSNYIKDCYIVVGYIDHNHSGTGKPFRNMAAVIKDNKVVATYAKQLLPFYDVFDEGRYFEPGTESCIIEMHGHKVGIAICEDVWNDKGSDDYNYDSNPLQIYRLRGVDTIISINSSPYIKGKAWKRIQMASKSVDSNPIKNFIYVNQIGGQDELVFDGMSFVIRSHRDGKGAHLTHISPTRTRNNYKVYNLNSREAGETNRFHEKNEYFESEFEPNIRDMLVLGLRDYVKKTGFKEVIFGSSGGVDSAVVATLAVDAVGARNVHAIRMPSGFTSDDSENDAIKLHKALGIHDYNAPISGMGFPSYEVNLHWLNQTAFKEMYERKVGVGRYNKVADENIQARMRDVYIMHFSNAFGALPLATGNKTESACGYYTHFDMSFGFAPLKDVYKQEILAMAKDDKRIPENIWQRPPSAELAEGQTDEDSLLPYKYLDLIVQANIEDYINTFEQFAEWLKEKQLWENKSGSYKGENRRVPKTEIQEWCLLENSNKLFDHIIKLISRNEYKRRQTCPGVKITPVAFGIGRRYPIVQRFV